jgi:hypothetical protein
MKGEGEGIKGRREQYCKQMIKYKIGERTVRFLDLG